MVVTTVHERPLSQKRRALARANEVRLARALLKRRVTAGLTTVADVLADKLMERLEISHWRTIESLTERQRGLVGREVTGR